MAKSIFHCLLAISFLSLLACDKIELGTYTTPAGIIMEAIINVNDLKAGVPFDQTVSLPTDTLKKLLAKYGNNVELAKMTVDSMALQIESTAPWTFADIQSAEILVEGKSLGTLPATAKGQSIALTPPSDVTQTDLKSDIKTKDAFMVRCKMTTKKATTASKLKVILRVKIEADLVVRLDGK